MPAVGEQMALPGIRPLVRVQINRASIYGGSLGAGLLRVNPA
jgi:hypothetical protein